MLTCICQSKTLKQVLFSQSFLTVTAQFWKFVLHNQNKDLFPPSRWFFCVWFLLLSQEMSVLGILRLSARKRSRKSLCWDCIRHFPIQRWAASRWNMTRGFTVRPAGLHGISTCYTIHSAAGFYIISRSFCKCHTATTDIAIYYNCSPPAVSLNGSYYLQCSSLLTYGSLFVLWRQQFKHTFFLFYFGLFEIARPIQVSHHLQTHMSREDTLPERVSWGQNSSSCQPIFKLLCLLLLLLPSLLLLWGVFSLYYHYIFQYCF